MKKLCVAAVLAFSFAAPAFADDAPADIWKAKCKSCHGANGDADTKEGKKSKIKDMTDPQWQAKNSDAEIKKVITDGKPDTKMKAYGNKLSAGEIDGLVKYIRTLKK